jgi:phosphopantothenoylcysteine decarboxylase/phosphopantothenate--cysteine ligase
VVIGVSGGIAAYKSVEILRQLVTLGNSVRVIMTRHATEFVHPRTFAVLSDHDVEVDQWDTPNAPGVDHVALSHWSDLLLVAPATANTIGKMAHGIADDALSTYHLAHRSKVVVAPAMNTIMWRHEATRSNLQRLQDRGVAIVEPASGELACGDEGEGRLAPISEVVDRVIRLLPRRGPLAGIRILVSSGPTREPIDSVRFLSNRSSGRMGICLAAEARRLGAEVTLLHGPLAVAPPPGVETVAVETAAEMGEALKHLVQRNDVALLAAAVADFAPRTTSQGKIDRRAGATSIELEPVPDLAAGVGQLGSKPYLVVFSAEVGTLVDRARAKMAKKGADAVVLNDISAPGVGMEATENEVWVLTAQGRERHVPRADKAAVAREILLTLSGEILALRAQE